MSSQYGREGGGVSMAAGCGLGLEVGFATRAMRLDPCLQRVVRHLDCRHCADLGLHRPDLYGEKDTFNDHDQNPAA